ncbi:hypothetical protein SCLCIDRAFT_981528 [Scleroderma citrinum Foug A]|uniref:Uncharacterized protein n=1 Tax=Scleroderma citrinum Foug A TaxID=1036808 RepID=A0A0C2ZDC1_9AGAM|nr:hypothetical protein SCLCIDRAFT_981528 [Scleroderma citrinum Foug A]
MNRSRAWWPAHNRVGASSVCQSYHVPVPPSRVHSPLKIKCDRILFTHNPTGIPPRHPSSLPVQGPNVNVSTTKGTKADWLLLLSLMRWLARDLEEIRRLTTVLCYTIHHLD